MLALWLTRLGVTVRIIDKTAEPGTTSRALAVQARTLEFYRQVQLADSVVERGVKIAGVNLWVKGARAARVPLQKIGEGLTPFPFALVFPQDAHERLLIERLDALGVEVERQTELIRFAQDGDNVQALLRRPDGTEETMRSGLSRWLRRRAIPSYARPSASAFPAEPTPGCSTSPMSRQAARRSTSNCTSISTRPTFCSFFP